MKLVFQGLVLGATLMYGYLYHSAAFLARFRYRRGSTVSQHRGDLLPREAEEALQEFSLQRDLWHLAREDSART